MRVLVAAFDTPLPPHGGSRLRMLHLSRQLALVGDLEMVAAGEVPADADEPFPIVGMPVRRSRPGVLVRSLRRPYLAAKLRSSGIDARLAGPGWDVIQVTTPFFVPAALRSGAPVVLDAHNVEAEIYRTLATSESRAAHRARWRWEAAKTERAERAAFAAATAVVATSDEDAEVMERWGAREVVVVPNGVDSYSITHRPPDAGATLLYVGQYGYRPNEAAAIELVDEVLPRVSHEVGDARVRLVGRDPSRALRRRASDAVEVTGEVDDIRPHLRTARALVLPLRAGSGTRLKVLEALAAGLPVVSTPLGVSGLEVRHGQEVLIGQTPAELADLTGRVVADLELAERLSYAGRALVERRYDWTIVAEPFVELHERLAMAQQASLS